MQPTNFRELPSEEHARRVEEVMLAANAINAANSALSAKMWVHSRLWVAGAVVVAVVIYNRVTAAGTLVFLIEKTFSFSLVQPMDLFSFILE